MVSELGFDLKPQRFTFQRRGVKYLFAEPNDGTGDVRVYYASGAYYTVNDVVLGDGIRALCRRVPWGYVSDEMGSWLGNAAPGDPACPAYVPRTLESSDAKAE